jgi:polyisoprenoid-binding protein YceI
MSSSAMQSHPSTTPARGRYLVDPDRSVVRFRTRHMFGLGGVTGTVRLRAAEIRVGDSIADTTVRAVLDADSFDSGNPNRDRTVRSSKYLDPSGFPDIDFATDGVDVDGERWIARGNLTARGRTAPVEVTVRTA